MCTTDIVCENSEPPQFGLLHRQLKCYHSEVVGRKGPKLAKKGASVQQEYKATL